MSDTTNQFIKNKKNDSKCSDDLKYDQQKFSQLFPNNEFDNNENFNFHIAPLFFDAPEKYNSSTII